MSAHKWLIEYMEEWGGQYKDVHNYWYYYLDFVDLLLFKISLVLLTTYVDRSEIITENNFHYNYIYNLKA